MTQTTPTFGIICHPLVDTNIDEVKMNVFTKMFRKFTRLKIQMLC